MEKKPDWFICIDCGVNGAAVLMNKEFELTGLIRMPHKLRPDGSSSVKKEVCSDQLADLINALIMECDNIEYNNDGKITNVIGLIEDPGVFSGGGPVALQSTANSFGIMKGVLSGIGIPYITVPAKTWKTQFGLKGGQKHKKDSVALAIELHPEIEPHIGNVTNDADIAEAVLIGDYCARYKLGVKT